MWPRIPTLTILALTFVVLGQGPQEVSAEEPPVQWRTISGIKSPMGLAFNAKTNTLFTVGFEGDVNAIDVSTDTVTTLPERGNAIAVNAHRNELYIASWAEQRVIVFNVALNEVTARISVPGNVSSMALNMVGGGRLYVNNVEPGKRDTKIQVIDVGSAQVIDTLDHAARNLAASLSGRLYATDQFDIQQAAVPTRLTMFDGIRDERIIDLELGPIPFDIDIEPETQTVYVATGIKDGVGPGQIWVVDGGALTTRRQIPMDTQINAIAVDSKTHSVYAANFYTNSITEFDSSGNKLGTADLGSPPSDIVVDETRNIAYVSNVNANTISVIGHGPPPGSLPPLGGLPRTDLSIAPAMAASGLALMALGGWLVLLRRRSKSSAPDV